MIAASHGSLEVSTPHCFPRSINSFCERDERALSLSLTSTLPLPDVLQPTPPGERAGSQSLDPPVYRELWFMVVMAGVALVLLAIVLGLLLHRTLSRHRPPVNRERPPLVPVQLEKRGPMAVSTPSNSYLVRESCFSFFSFFGKNIFFFFTFLIN